MTLLRHLVPSTRGVRAPLAWAVAGGSLLLGLAACGGGDPVTDFDPERILVLGDETSVITDGTGVYPPSHPQAGQAIPAGRNYSINGLDPAPPDPPASAVDNEPPGPIDCRGRRIWVQVLADEYGFRFEECNNDPDGTPQRGIIYAGAGARVADIASQVAQHEATSRFTPSDLVTVLVGQHDILDLYAGVTPANSCATAATQARSRGEALAVQINRIARGGSGGRVVFVTVPRQGDTPFGRQTTVDPNRRQCLNQLTDAFNTGLRTDVTNDGRHMALVAIDEQARLIVDDSDRFGGYDNVRDAACTVAAPDCTSETLVPDAASGDDFLWADELHFGPEFHDLLGDIAVDRVRNDVPF